MMSLSWFVLFLCIFGALAIEHQQFGKHPKRVPNKKDHPRLNIIHGKKTSVAKYPFIASFQQGGYQMGAAVILNKRWLLTTAFNAAWVPVQDLHFRVGSNSYSDQGQVLGATVVVGHPNYTGSWDWDIAVVKTDKPIKFNKKVKAVKLGTKKPLGGTKAWVAGWGDTNSTYSTSPFLLEATVTVYDWNKCEQIYKSDLSDRLMCTFDKTAGPSVYDYGDPLVVDNVLYGLFAGGYSFIPGQYPVLYTDIPSLYQWIQGAITSEEDD